MPHQAVAHKHHLYITGGEFTSPSQMQFYHHRDMFPPPPPSLLLPLPISLLYGGKGGGGGGSSRHVQPHATISMISRSNGHTVGRAVGGKVGEGGGDVLMIAARDLH